MNKVWLNYHHLYYFMTIAELNSISRAAEQLRLGQPTLSAQLKQFEDNLGVKLFERQHKKLILTEHGLVALEYARNIFKLGGEMYEALNDRLKPSRVSVQLAALDSIPKQVMLQLTRAALDIAPCSISLVEGKFDDLMQELTTHKVDLAITNFLPRLEATKHLHHKVISRHPIGIYGSPRFKSLKKKFPESIQGQPMVLPTYDSQLRYDIDHWMSANGLNVELVAEIQDTALKKLMAVDGLALIPATAYSVESQVKNGELVLLGVLDKLFEEIFLLSVHRKISNPVAAELMKSFHLE